MPNEKAAWSAARDFFVSLEKTETSRSYKIVLLLAMLDGETLVPSLSIEEITRRVAVLAKRMHRLAEDFSVDLSDMSRPSKTPYRQSDTSLCRCPRYGRRAVFQIRRRDLRLRVRNLPIRLLSARSFGRSSIGGSRSICHEVEWPMLFVGCLETLADSRFCSCRRTRAAALPEGPLEIEVDGRPMEAIVAKIAVNVVRAPGDFDQ